jgi:hypothetical protein
MCGIICSCSFILPHKFDSTITLVAMLGRNVLKIASKDTLRNDAETRNRTNESHITIPHLDTVPPSSRISVLSHPSHFFSFSLLLVPSDPLLPLTITYIASAS